MQKTSIKQLNTFEVMQVHGGRGSGDRVHIFGLHSRDIVMYAAMIPLGLLALYVKHPNLTKGVTLFTVAAAVGAIAYKILADSPDSQEKNKNYK